MRAHSLALMSRDPEVLTGLGKGSEGEQIYNLASKNVKDERGRARGVPDAMTYHSRPGLMTSPNM